MPPISIKVVAGREASDCAVAAVATYFSLRYEDVLKEAVLLDPDYKLAGGLFIEQITALAKKLGKRLRFRKRINLEEDDGIVVFADHVANLMGGVLIDPDGTVWHIEDYMSAYPKTKVEGLMYEPVRKRRA